MSTERRLLARALGAVGETVALDEQAAHHVRVLRLPVGAPITLFDGAGRRASATLIALEPQPCARIEALLVDSGRRIPIVLVQCLPKGGKIDDLVRGATELGVDAIHLATSDHTVAKSDERWERKQERLVRIAEEAARQAERDDVPTLVAPAPLLDHASRAPQGALRLTLCGRSGSRIAEPATEEGIWLVVGPEGGLAERELIALDGLGYRRATIAPTILRVETAAIAALGYARHLVGADRDR